MPGLMSGFPAFLRFGKNLVNLRHENRFDNRDAGDA
jgi:hypothetical protein